jgi:hypothetical protein
VLRAAIKYCTQVGISPDSRLQTDGRHSHRPTPVPTPKAEKACYPLSPYTSNKIQHRCHLFLALYGSCGLRFVKVDTIMCCCSLQLACSNPLYNEGTRKRGYRYERSDRSGQKQVAYFKRMEHLETYCRPLLG